MGQDWPGWAAGETESVASEDLPELRRASHTAGGGVLEPDTVLAPVPVPISARGLAGDLGRDREEGECCLLSIVGRANPHLILSRTEAGAAVGLVLASWACHSPPKVGLRTAYQKVACLHPLIWYKRYAIGPHVPPASRTPALLFLARPNRGPGFFLDTATGRSYNDLSQKERLLGTVPSHCGACRWLPPPQRRGAEFSIASR